jgi:hypothetical protein
VEFKIQETDPIPPFIGKRKAFFREFQLDLSKSSTLIRAFWFIFP